MPPKAIVFDLGNVLIEVDHARGVRALKARGVVSGVFDDTGIAQSVLCEYESGRLDRTAFHRAVCGECSSVSLDDFCAIYCDIFAPVRPMIAANAALRRSGLRTYVFSNTSELHFEHLRARFGFMSAFDGYFLSYELGFMKPQAEGYAAVEEGTGLSGEEIVYLDDRIENVEAGRARGWIALHHRAPAVTLEKLSEVGLF